MKNKFLLIAAFLFAATTVVTAQTIRGTAKNQTKRIVQGVKSGELTKKEAHNLVHDQREIRNDVKQAKADGTVTKAERKTIKKEQKRANREISRKKNNERDRH